MSRKSMMNKAITDEIILALVNGLTRETAARYAKISYQTLFNWYNRGKREHERVLSGEKAPRKLVRAEAMYLDFFNQMEAAETQAIVGWQETVNLAAKTDPFWAMRMLSLRDARGYRTTDISATLDLSKATDEQLERIASGEDPITVMASSGAGAAGTAQA